MNMINDTVMNLQSTKIDIQYLQNYPADLVINFAFHHILFSDITERNQLMTFFQKERPV